MTTTTDIYDHFKPRDYLNYYYNRIDDENRSLLEFFAESYKGVPTDAHMIEFGGGPTVYQIISAAKYVKKIDFCDYLQSNIDEIELWKGGSAKAFNWDNFIRQALDIERHAVNESAVKERSKLVKNSLSELLQGNAFLTDPCGEEYREKYDVMGLVFVPEGITNSKPAWESALKNILTLLKPGGILVTAAILGADYWHSGPQSIPAANLVEADFNDTFPKLGLSIITKRTIPSEVPDPDDPDFTGYTGMIFIKAVKT